MFYLIRGDLLDHLLLIIYQCNGVNKMSNNIDNIKEIQITKIIYIKEVTYKEYLEIHYPKINTELVRKEVGNKQGFMTFAKVGDSFIPYGWFSETIEGLRGYK